MRLLGKMFMPLRPTGNRLIALAASLALWPTVASVSRADIVISEDFAEGLDTVLFHITTDPGVTIEVVSEQLQVTGDQGAGEPPHYSGGYLFANFVLVGDFDVSVYYDSFSAPYPGPGKSTWCGLIFYEATGPYVCSVGRERGLAADLDRYIAYPQPWGELDTSETSGHLRMVRNGSTFQAYCGTTLLGTKTLTSTPILVGVGGQRLEHLQSFNVTYDNLEIEADNAELYIRQPGTTLSGNVDMWHAVHVVDGGSIVVPEAQWDGGTWIGGYLMLEADTIYVDSTSSIHADACGFSKEDGHSDGGPGHGDDFAWDTHGALYNPTGAGHGGQGGSCQNTVPGGNGGDIYGSESVDPCDPLGNCDPDLVFGSAGGDYFRLLPYVLVRGSRGGGYVRLVASDTITIEGTVSADGADGVNAEIELPGAGGGGGSGGYIVMSAPTIELTGTLSAQGGDGSAPSEPFSSGGGAGGRIIVAGTSDPVCVPASAVAGGAGACYGLGDGDPGTVHLPGIATAIPTITGLANDTGRDPNDLLTNDATIQGTASADSLVRLYVGGSVVGSGQSDPATGDFEITAALDQGTNGVTATAQENCANESGQSDPFIFTLDTLAPDPPSQPDMIEDGFTGGRFLNDNIVSTPTPTFAGTAEPDAEVTLYEASTPLGNVITADGSRSIVSSTLSEGNHQISATAKDAAGNESGASSALSITIDLTDPVITNPTVTPTGCVPIGRVFDLSINVTDALSGVQDAWPPEATVRKDATNIGIDLSPAGGSLYQGTWDSDGAEPGTYTVDFEAWDLAGNSQVIEDAGAICLALPGDHDFDGDVALQNFARFQTCFTGTGGTAPPGCEMMEMDGDGAVDLTDFASFEANRTGPQ